LTVAIHTLVSLSIALPLTMAVTYWRFGGDLSLCLSGWSIMSFGLEVTTLECLVVAPFLAYRSAETLRIVSDLRDRLGVLASRDPLTGLLNRRGFDEAIAGLPKGGPMAVAVCDIDHFKRINDDFGHEAGDSALRAVAELLSRRAQAWPDALPARFGGEEFVFALPGAELAEGERFAESMRAALAARCVNGAPMVCASFGVAAAEAFDGDISGLIARADAALYRAKHQGRNRVVAERGPPREAAA
jgi:diguanylate cyclase (GGDEF)-like protein